MTLTVRLLAAALAIAAGAGCSAGARQSNAPLHPEKARWATYQRSPDRNAVLRTYQIPNDWSYGSKAKINGGLALVGNRLLFTTFAGRLVALDVRTGRELWHAQMPNIVMSTPIVAGSTVYVGTGRNGVLKRRLRDGITLRNVLLRLRYGPDTIWGVTQGDEIAAFDLRTGTQRWVHRTVGEDMPSALYDRGRLIFANGDRHAYALRADTGRPLWSSKLDGVATMASPVLAGGAVVVAVCADKSHSALALDPRTGKILWRSPYGHCDAAPAYGDGKVFLPSTWRAGNMRLRGKTVVAALDAKTGKPVWVFRGDKLGLWSAVASSEAAIAGTYASGIYYQPAPFTDELLAFNAKTGSVLWRFRTSGPIKMSPVVADGRLYAGDTAGLLYTLNARTGKLLELRGFKQPFTTSPPIVAGDKLLVVNGMTVNAIPLSGKPAAPKGVGWEAIADQ